MAAPVADRPRPVGEVLATGVLAGAFAAAAVGALDACFAWRAATQFTPGVLTHLRFVLFVALTHALAGMVVGLIVTPGLLVLSRETRLGDMLRFGHGVHLERRARDPLTAMSGLALVLAGLPIVVGCVLAAYKIALPQLASRHAMDLVVAVAIGAGVVALGVAVPLAFVVARQLERLLALALRPAPRIARAASWPYAPIVALIAMVAVGLAWLVAREWETAQQLPLRAPLVVLLGALLAVPAWRPARAVTVLLSVMLPWLRRATWVIGSLALVGLILLGGSEPVTKATASFTGIGGPIVRGLRTAFDWDRDGYARFLGGGDCDDGDASVHPGAAEIPDDGIDQNCVGGDSSVKPTREPIAFAPVPASVPKDFDVLVITIDTTRADHLGAYGYARPTSPNLDRLAAEGTLFEHAWAHAPSTRYSMPAILTGRLPLDVFYDYTVDRWPGLLPRATTFGELMKPLGFHTGAITNFWYFEQKRHMDQGFDEYDNENSRLHSDQGGPEESRGTSSRQQSDKAIAFVDNHAAERFFLWVHYYDPHYGYELHPEVTSFGTDNMARYDNEIEFTDQQIGRVFDELRAKGLYDKTVVVVTGDHGEGFGEHKVFFHGYHLYAAQTKVPLIIKVPGLPPRRAQTPAGHDDLMATLANLAGAPPSDDMEGRSLVDVIAGHDVPRVVLQQLSYENNHEMRGAATADCHVIYNVSPDTSWEVYRVDRDPMETEDLAATDECADTRTALARRYDQEQIPPGAVEALLAARPAIARPLGVKLGTSVELLAVDAPTTAKAGDTIVLTWTFAATGRVATGWKMFVHGELGKTFASGDHRPTRPFEWWKPGQFIRYTSQLAIPKTARGTMPVLTGMFEGPHRATVVAPGRRVVDNAVEVARIEVLP